MNKGRRFIDSLINCANCQTKKHAKKGNVSGPFFLVADCVSNLWKSFEVFTVFLINIWPLKMDKQNVKN